jgi:hypothetical protein
VAFKAHDQSLRGLKRVCLARIDNNIPINVNAVIQIFVPWRNRRELPINGIITFYYCYLVQAADIVSDSYVVTVTVYSRPPI